MSPRPERADLVSCGIGIESRVGPVREWEGEGEAHTLGDSVRQTQVQRIDIEVEPPAGWGGGLIDLGSDEPLVGPEMPVRRADLPFARREEALSLSAQTGGREAHRHSALTEGLLTRREQSDQHAESDDRSLAWQERNPHGTLLVWVDTGSPEAR